MDEVWRALGRQAAAEQSAAAFEELATLLATLHQALVRRGLGPEIAAILVGQALRPSPRT